MPHQCTGCGHTFEDGSKEMLSGCPECGGNKFQFRPAGEEFPEGPEPTDPPDAEAPPGTDGASSVAETVGRATTRVRDFVSADGPEEGPGEEPDPNAAWPGETGAADASEGDDADIIDADARRDPEDEDAPEGVAQASARTDVVSEDELGVTDTGEDTGDALPDDWGGPTPGAPAPNADADSSADTAADDPSEAPDVGSDGRVVSEPSEDDPDLTELREQLNDQFESIKIVERGEYELNLMELYDREEYIIALQENGRYVIQVPDQWMGERPDER